MKRLTNLARLSVAVAVATGAATTESCSQPPVPPLAERASGFAEAINGDQVERLVSLSATPFFYREQVWESASDGTGFVLGAVQDILIEDDESLTVLLSQLASELELEQTDPVDDQEAVGDLPATLLAGTPAASGEMELFLFLRGLGDVEHVLVVGLDRQSGKVTLLYVN